MSKEELKNKDLEEEELDEEEIEEEEEEEVEEERPKKKIKRKAKPVRKELTGWQKVKRGIKRHWKTAAWTFGGAAVGSAATYGIGKLGERRMQRRHEEMIRQAQQQEEYSSLDPNV